MKALLKNKNLTTPSLMFLDFVKMPQYRSGSQNLVHYFNNKEQSFLHLCRFFWHLE